jgi:hypothetical protein
MIRLYIVRSILLLSLLFSYFNFSSVSDPAYRVFVCDQIPELNKKIIAFVKSNLNKKVGKGECWDLAAQALYKVGATWDKNYVFGKEIDPKKNCIYEGDIMQFEGVQIEYQKKNTFYTEELEHHTAIIYKVNDKGNFVMAEQNTSTHGKKVGLNALELKNILKGTYKIFRPVN